MQWESGASYDLGKEQVPQARSWWKYLGGLRLGRKGRQTAAMSTRDKNLDVGGRVQSCNRRASEASVHPISRLVDREEFSHRWEGKKKVQRR